MLLILLFVIITLQLHRLMHDKVLSLVSIKRLGRLEIIF